MKKILKSQLFAFIIGVLIAATTTVYATIYVISGNVDFIPKNSNWHVNSVEEALNDLYDHLDTGY